MSYHTQGQCGTRSTATGIRLKPRNQLADALVGPHRQDGSTDKFSKSTFQQASPLRRPTHLFSPIRIDSQTDSFLSSSLGMNISCRVEYSNWVWRLNGWLLRSLSHNKTYHLEQVSSPRKFSRWEVSYQRDGPDRASSRTDLLVVPQVGSLSCFGQLVPRPYSYLSVSFDLVLRPRRSRSRCHRTFRGPHDPLGLDNQYPGSGRPG